MATNQPKDILTRVADLSEEALQRLPNFPGGERLLDAVHQSRIRLDEMQKKLRGVDVLERRVDELEKRLAKLEKPPKTPAAKKPPAPPEPPSE
jgi:uncharacterized protein involved in exopolysaccharide biosynthesis